MTYPTLDSIISDWPAWGLNSKPELIKPFTQGLNHHTCLLQIKDRRLVVKQFTEPHQQAVESQRWAAEIGLSPKILFAEAEYNYCVMEAVVGQTLHPNSVNTSTLLALAKGLRSLHDADFPQVENFDFMWFCEQYLQVTDSKAQQIHYRVLPILESFVNDSTPWCFCHNDLVSANCFVVDGKALFIDWEYAQAHNPWFDVAAIVYYLKLNVDQTELLLQAYQPELSNITQKDIFYTSQCALVWGDILWHLACDEASNWHTLKEKYADLQRFASYFQINL